jgi:hypothetical protein
LRIGRFGQPRGVAQFAQKTQRYAFCELIYRKHLGRGKFVCVLSQASGDLLHPYLSRAFVRTEGSTSRRAAAAKDEVNLPPLDVPLPWNAPPKTVLLPTAV